MNAVEIQEAIEELIQQPYAPSAFIEGFMTAYGASADRYEVADENGSLQFKGASGFLECIPFNAHFAPQRAVA